MQNAFTESENPPKPARTPPPAQFAESIVWLGPRYGELRFHSSERSRQPRVVVVNYAIPDQSPPLGDPWFAD